MRKMLVVFGTRPEAIKLAPFILAAKEDPRFLVRVCSTGQHKEMLEPILNFFDIHPDYDLQLMRPGQTLTDISVGVLKGVEEILKAEKFDLVVVQGDTTTCFMSSLAAFYQKVSVSHIEAGLRSGDMYSPYPEEFNRRVTGLIAEHHFAPTENSKLNLIREHYLANSIYVTGNTGIDSLMQVRSRMENNPELFESFEKRFSFLDKNRKMILVTIHRRESFGEPMEQVMKGLLALAKRDDVEILIPLHLNPQVRASAKKIFSNHAVWSHEGKFDQKSKGLIWLCEPVEYVPFVYLMNRAHIIITDSGGVQEEAPSLGKPILVAREKTERPEAIEAGTSLLIPLQETLFLELAYSILDSKSLYAKMAQAKNPFGDGKASERILNILAK